MLCGRVLILTLCGPFISHCLDEPESVIPLTRELWKANWGGGDGVDEPHKLIVSGEFKFTHARPFPVACLLYIISVGATSVNNYESNTSMSNSAAQRVITHHTNIYSALGNGVTTSKANPTNIYKLSIMPRLDCRLHQTVDLAKCRIINTGHHTAITPISKYVHDSIRYFRD